jgi:hypothetical protein
MLYFLLHDAERFQGQLSPLLAAAWRERSFAPCRELHSLLRDEVREFHDSIGRSGDDTLLEKASAGLAFDRLLWRELVGEVLWFAAAELPDFQTEPDTLCCILAPERYRAGDAPRESWSPIEQAHFGSRDLLLGGFYRPDRAGWNDSEDVARLQSYLANREPDEWTADRLAHHRELTDYTDRAEFLDDARGALTRLRELYAQARERGHVVICEEL